MEDKFRPMEGNESLNGRLISSVPDHPMIRSTNS
jgi:hypothetical protein